MKSVPALLILISIGVHPLTTATAEPDWLTGLRKFDHISHPLKQQFIDLLTSVSTDAKIRGKVSEECISSLQAFASGLEEDDYKSMMMFDSFPKIKSGMISSQGYDYGSYQQCLSVGRYVYFGVDFPLPDKETSSATSKTWQSEYSKGMNVRKMTPYTSAICLPNECSKHDMEVILSDSDVMKQSIHPLRVEIFTTESRSDPLPPIPWVKIISITLISLQILVCVIATAYNFFDPVHPISKKMLAFDVIQNTRSLFQDMREGSMNHDLAPLNLFRIGFISMAMVFHTTIGMSGVLTHVTEHVASSPSLIGSIFPVIPGSMTMNAVLSASLSIVTWLPVMRQREVSFMQFVIMRIFRTLPVLMGFILLTQTLPLISFGGPMMKHVQENTARLCYENGWTEVAFLSNFLPVTQMCNPVNWIVSLDMQLYVLSFFLIKLLVRNEKKAYIFVAIQVVFGCLASLTYSWYNDVPAVLSFTLKNVHQTLADYAKITHHTVHYLAVYPLGTMMGYFMLKQGTHRKPLGYNTAVIISAISAICLTFVGNAYDENMGFKYPGYEYLFTATSRLVLASCAIAGFWALVCSKDQVILFISRSKIVTVTSRLSFSILVTHVLMIHFVITSFETLNSSPLISGMMIATVTVFSYITGILMYLIVEAPYHNVLMNITRGKRPLDQKTKDVNENVTKIE